MRKGITIFSKRQIRERMDMYFNIHTIIIMWVIDYTIAIVFGRLVQDGVGLCFFNTSHPSWEYFNTKEYHIRQGSSEYSTE